MVGQNLPTYHIFLGRIIHKPAISQQTSIFSIIFPYVSYICWDFRRLCLAALIHDGHSTNLRLCRAHRQMQWGAVLLLLAAGCLKRLKAEKNPPFLGNPPFNMVNIYIYKSYMDYIVHHVDLHDLYNI